MRSAGFPRTLINVLWRADVTSPPDDAQLEPLLNAAHLHQITVIAGLPLEQNGQRQKGLVLFSPARHRILRYPQGRGASLVPGDKHLSILDAHPDSPNLDPRATLVTSCQSVGDHRWRQSISNLQRFAHKYAIAVLMANACGGSALWDEKGQLVVRADKGELLVTGTLGGEGWQGDIIPLG